MSIIENLRAKPPGPKLPSFDEIDARLKQNERQLAEQRARVLELDAALGEIAAAAPLSAEHRRADAALREANDNLHLLNQAHQGLLAQREKAMLANRAELVATQRKACRKHLGNLRTASDALAHSLADAVKHYHTALDAASKAISATPLDTTLPDGTGIAPGKLKAEVMAELFRLSAPATGGSIGRDTLKLFPGASSPDIHFEDQPEAIQAFADKVRDAVETVTRLIDAPAP